MESLSRAVPLKKCAIAACPSQNVRSYPRRNSTMLLSLESSPDAIQCERTPNIWPEFLLNSARTFRGQGVIVRRFLGMLAVLGFLRATAIVHAAEGSSVWGATSLPFFRRVTVAASADFTTQAAAGGADEVFEGCCGDVPNGHGIYISHNSGVSWAQTSAPKSDWSALAISANGSTVIAGAHSLHEEPSLYFSIDSGTNWTQASVPLADWTAVACSADGVKMIAASTSYNDQTGRVFQSSDRGASWRATGLPTAFWTSVAMSADGNRMFAAASIDIGPKTNENGIYISIDSGANWLRAKVPESGWSLACSADGRRVVAGGRFVSADSGLTWNTTAAPADCCGKVSCSADGNVFAGTTASGILFSEDDGETWKDLAANSPLAGEGSIDVAVSADGNRLLAVTDENTSSNADCSVVLWPHHGQWDLLDLSPPFESSWALSPDGNTLLAWGGGQPFKSRNLGGAWEPMTFPSRRTALTISADGARWFAGTYGEGIYVSEDAGVNWRKTGSPYTSSNAWTQIATSANGMKLLASQVSDASIGGALFTSQDAGTNWMRTSAPANKSWNTLASSADGSKLIALSDSIYSSQDSGATWVLSDAPTNYTWSALFCSADGSRAIACGLGGGDRGVYSSTDTGRTWFQISDLSFAQFAGSADGATLLALADYQGSFGPVYVSKDWGTNWASTPFQLREWVGASADGQTLLTADRFQSIARLNFNPTTLPPSPAQPPKLETRLTGSGVQCSWLIPSSWFVLQQNSDLNAFAWNEVTTAPTLNLTNLRYELALPPSTNRAFYRLKQR